MDLGCRCPVWHLEGDRMLWSVGAQVALVTTATNEVGPRGSRLALAACALRARTRGVARLGAEGLGGRIAA